MQNPVGDDEAVAADTGKLQREQSTTKPPSVSRA